MGNLFKGRMQVPYGYSCFGYTRGNGKTWHGGLDVVGLDSTQVRALRDGEVIRSRMVTDRTNKTWEWGNYVTIRTDCGEQDIYAHLERRAVAVGQRVKAGDVIGIMGNTGNAAGGYKHTHYERRKADGVTAIDPAAVCGCANRVGIYGQSPVQPLSGEAVSLKISASQPLSSGDVALLRQVCEPLGIATREENGALITDPASSGDQIAIIQKAQELNLSVALYNAAPSKVQVTVDSLRVRTGPGVEDYVQVGSVHKGDVLETLQVRDGWAYVVTGEKDGWVCLGEDGELYAKAV